MTKNFVHLLYHIFVLLLSAVIAFSIPHIFSILAKHLLSFWALIEDEKVFLVSLEILTAAALIIFFNSLRRGWEAGKISRLAASVGLVTNSSVGGGQRSLATGRLKPAHGVAGDIMIIGSTGFRTFTSPEGELHEAVRNCRQARILLLNPFGEGAAVRARSIPDPEITPEVIQEQIMLSVDFLRERKAFQKNIRLKLYSDVPLLKLAILGDHAILRHYHMGFNVRDMPEYVFTSDSLHGGLYLPLYRYFLTRWNDPAIPEYDLDSDELVFCDRLGREIKRVELPGRVNVLASLQKERQFDLISAKNSIDGLNHDEEQSFHRKNEHKRFRRESYAASLR